MLGVVKPLHTHTIVYRLAVLQEGAGHINTMMVAPACVGQLSYKL